VVAELAEARVGVINNGVNPLFRCWLGPDAIGLAEKLPAILAFQESERPGQQRNRT